MSTKQSIATVTDIGACRVVETEAQLVDAIRGEHEQAILSVSRGIEHARRAGDYLVMAKKKIGEHGRWEEWFYITLKSKNFSLRTAQRYMRLAANWERLAAKASDVTLLTLTQAMEALTNDTVEEPKAGQAESLSLPGMEPAPPPRAAMGFRINPFVDALIALSERAERIDANDFAASVSVDQLKQILKAGETIAGLLVTVRVIRKSSGRKAA